jgi:hypothetical protein
MSYTYDGARTTVATLCHNYDNDKISYVINYSIPEHPDLVLRCTIIDALERILTAKNASACHRIASELLKAINIEVGR